MFRNKTRKIAMLLASAGVGVGLLGSGVYASFTDSATATQSVKVGTMGLTITSTQSGVTTDGKNVSYTASQINSSAAGSAPFVYSVNNTGSVNEQVTITPSGLSGPFSAILAPADQSFSLPAGQSHVVNDGIAWTALSNGDEGQSVTLTDAVNVTG